MKFDIEKLSDPDRKNGIKIIIGIRFGIIRFEKSIGFRVKNFWYWKKYRYGFGKKIGIVKKYRVRYQNFLALKKVSA